MKDECDINLIIKRHQDTGAISHINPKAPQFGDFATPYDLKSAMDAVQQASETFESLSAEVRREANNNPVRFLEMLENPEDAAKLAAAGLDISVPEATQDAEKTLIPQSGPAPPKDPPPEDPPEGRGLTDTASGVSNNRYIK